MALTQPRGQDRETQSPHLGLARRLAARFGEFADVQAVAVAGSLASNTVDQDSDIDLYVFTNAPVPLRDRVALVEELGATRADLGLQYWDPGDEWYDRDTGIEVDVIYWDTAWIEGQLNRVLVEHQASLGYSTCFWHTIRNATILHDRGGWLQGLKERSLVPFPEALRQEIMTKNHAVLRTIIPSYFNQLVKAVKRDDPVSVNHRLAALLASYFDVLFALNRLTHPGEKRLLRTAYQLCTIVPRDMVSQVRGVLAAPGGELIARAEALLDGLDQLLLDEGFDVPSVEKGIEH